MSAMIPLRGWRGNTRRRIAWSATPMSIMSAKVAKLTNSDHTRIEAEKNKMAIAKVNMP